jgi:hypothetical protein
MLALTTAIVCACVLASATFSQAATNQFTMPLRGVALPARDFKLVNHIPQNRLARLPKKLPVYRYTNLAREFPVRGLQILLDQSAFAGTNIADLLSVGTNRAVSANGIRLVSQDRLDYFIVSPGEGRITVKCAERGRRVPQPDAVPSFEAIQAQMFRLVGEFGITTTELERQQGGSFFLRNRVGENFSFGGTVKSVISREVEICRAIPDFPFNSINDDRIALKLGVDGQLRSFTLTWPTIVPVATNKLASMPKLLQQIKRGLVLSDVMNEYPKSGISEIELKDITIEYYLPGQPLSLGEAAKTEIYPVASMLAVFKSATGEAIEAGIYTPIMESR